MSIMKIKDALECTKNMSEMYVHGESMRRVFSSLHDVLEDQELQLAAANTKITELEAALELGQENCDDAYDDLRDELASAKAELAAEREKREQAESELEAEREAAYLEDRCPKCGSTEVYYENANTGSGKTTCQDCGFEGEEEEFITVRQLINAKEQAEAKLAGIRETGPVLYWRKKAERVEAALAAEISKKDKSIQLAAKELSEYGRCCPDCIDEGGCEYDAETLAKCYENWLAWLERGSALEQQKTATFAAEDPK